MKFLSTRGKSPQVTFIEAIFNGLAPDGGLYVPVHIPQFTEKEIELMSDQSFTEIATDIAYKFLEDEIEKHTLREIISQQIDFDAPLHQLKDGKYILELFHGPTLAFKDFGARFLAGIMSHYAKTKKQKITILTATSGDTGAAVANGFHKIKNIDVIIIYPKNKVSELQRKQMTTLGDNIKCIELNGNFDDCQSIVKKSFADKELVKKLNLTSANSINIGRLIPQIFYYFYSYSRLQKHKRKIIYSVPSGNFGNLAAGLLAKKMGLKGISFVAATNINNVVPEYLQTGIFKPRASVETISSAMDIGNPSNLERIQYLYKQDINEIKKDVYGTSATDEETKIQIKKTFSLDSYICDPHTAVALLGLEKRKKTVQDSIIEVAIATAAPEKFITIMEDILEINLILQKNLKNLKNKPETKINLNIEDCATYLAKSSYIS